MTVVKLSGVYSLCLKGDWSGITRVYILGPHAGSSMSSPLLLCLRDMELPTSPGRITHPENL